MEKFEWFYGGKINLMVEEIKSKWMNGPNNEWTK